MIRFFVLTLIIFWSCNSSGTGSKGFDFNNTLRVDFVLAGDHYDQSAYLVQVTQYKGWSGSDNQLVSPFSFGEYRYLLVHPVTGDTLFYRGFSTLFEEWRTIDEAKCVTRAFQQTVLMPKPLEEMIFIVDGRQRNGIFSQLIKERIDPNSLSVKVFQPYMYNYKILHGDEMPSEKADFLILADGYAADEEELFFKDAKRLTRQIINTEPFKSLGDLITVRALAVVSNESGVSDPNSIIWKTSALKTSFNIFGIDRYIVTEAFWQVHDFAAQLPHDHIIILVNGDKYGGGGIYNHFSVVTSGNRFSAEVLLHELGHGFGGLADEYYDSEVSYSDFINQEIEPWQPNLTTLVDFNLKWKNLLSDDLPVPTPIRPKYRDVTGVYEGGGYVSKGVYRPAINCRMRAVDAPSFCEVCTETLRQKIFFYSKSE